MEEVENAMEYENDADVQENFEEDAGFDNDDIGAVGGDNFPSRGRGRGNFRYFRSYYFKVQY